MRVCYVAHEAVSKAGWGRYTVEVVSGVRQLGIEPVLVTADSQKDPSLTDVEHYPILPPVLTRRLETPRSLLKIPQLRRILQTCDAVHCIVELYAPLVALALPPKMPFILSVFGTWAIRPLENQVQRLFFAPAFRKASKIISISGFTRDWMAKLMTMPPTEVLPGGVHPARFQQPVEAELPVWVGKEPVALSVGAVKPRKGMHVSLEAVALAREKIPNLHYAIAGNINEIPDYTAALKKRISELGLENQVHFLGQLPPYSTLVAWYQQADVFLLPSVNQGSSFEGLGFVFLEAAAAGTPAIGTYDCGAMEAVVHEETGLLVPQNDPQATADALVRLLTDKPLYEKMKAAAPFHADRLSWTNLARRLAQIYEEERTAR
ncbi:MAG: glycosyltransferase family 4 protein [Anaerolineae bacterium]|nr:glycosyltransferase family 4 protein [Anaerolineae bacterium]